MCATIYVARQRQIYAEAESIANLFAMPRRSRICGRQAKLRRSWEQCKLVRHAERRRQLYENKSFLVRRRQNRGGRIAILLKNTIFAVL